ncbi:MAG: DUF5677 domain-containing protein, partial [Devosia sp.]
RSPWAGTRRTSLTGRVPDLSQIVALMNTNPKPTAPPRVINFYSEPSPPHEADRRPTLIVRIDRKPINDEARAVLESGAFGDLNAYQKATLRWPNASEESLNSLGFLSPEIERFREHVRASPQALVWIEFTRKLATFGLNILHSLEIPTDGGPRLATAALFKRTHESMQAAVILAEHGIISDARSVVRGAVENAIAIHALAKDPDFTEQLRAGSKYDELQIARMMLETPEYRAEIPTEIARLEALVVELEALKKSKPEECKRVNWAGVAHKYGCQDLYGTLYRMMSADGTHVTINAIARCFEVNDAGEVTMMKVGPDTDGLVISMNAACIAFMSSVEPLLSHYPNADFTARLTELTQEFKSLSVEELDWINE